MTQNLCFLDEDDDDEDDFSESFDDDDSNDASSDVADLSNDQTMEEETCRNSNSPHLSLSLANSFGTIPSIESANLSSFLEETTLSPEVEVQKSYQNESETLEMDRLKRERESDGFDSFESSPKKAKKTNTSLKFEAEVHETSFLSLSELNPKPTKVTVEIIKSPEHLPEILNATTEIIQENENSNSNSVENSIFPTQDSEKPILPILPSENSISPILPPEKPKIDQETIKILSENESDDDVGIPRPSLRKSLKPLSDESDDAMDTNPAPDSCSDDSNAPLIRHSSKRIVKTSRLKRKNVIADDSSSMSSEVSDKSRTKELSSRLPKLDSNSNEKTTVEDEKLAEKTAKTIKEDSTAEVVNGFSDNEDSRLSETSTEVSSVSSSRTSTVKSKTKDLNKRRSKKAGKPPEKPATTKNKRRSRKNSQTSEISKKVFVKELLETAVESKVPYDEILQGIKACVVGKRLGRVSLKSSKEDEIRKQEYFEKLKALQFFRCGSCEFDVTKHKWTEHFLSHGGFAWVDGFETPIELTDWNEALRRMIHGFKIYKQSAMRCPNCGEEKRSALGHLSHIIVCGESEEALEGKKLTCVHCSERFLPFYASSHKTKCTGMVTVVLPSNDDEARESEKEENSLESFNVSGRQKRNAVKK